MEKVEIKDNPLKLNIYINGKPSLDTLSEETQNAFINALTEKVITYIMNKQNKKK